MEALCELFFVGSSYDVTVPGRFYERIKQTFPGKQEHHIFQTQLLNTPSGPSLDARAVLPRMQFRNFDKNRLVQLGPDLLVVNQLAPYVRFEDWEADIASCARHYQELASPAGIERLGMRYINVIDIPVSDNPTHSLAEYFQVRTELPRSLDPLGSFQLRLEILFENHHKVLLTLANAPTHRPAAAAYLLDLYDIYTPPDIFAVDAIGQHLDDAHVNLGRVFEESLLPDLKNTFEPQTP